MAADLRTAAAVPSRTAALTWVTAKPIDWVGGSAPVFAADRSVYLTVRLDAAGVAAGRSIPRAVLTVTLKDPSDEAVLARTETRLRDVPAGTPLTAALRPEDLRNVPLGRPVSAVAQLRWPTRLGATYQALGTTDLVFCRRCLVIAGGDWLPGDRELVDQGLYRSFWNQVWRSPVLDGTDDGPRRWALEATMKYTILLSDAASNGFMQPRASAPAAGDDVAVARTGGRIKAGTELSVLELNKLLPLWPGRASLDEDQVAALAAPAFRQLAAGEAVRRLDLAGRAGQQGLVWATPVLALRDVVLGTVAGTDDHGQVTALTTESRAFPLPRAVRLLGLLTGEAAEDAGGTSPDQPDDPRYRFEGYRVAFSTKVGLSPGPDPGRR